jgi:hypothetical protein
LLEKSGWPLLAGFIMNMGAPSRVCRYCSQAEARADVKSHLKRFQISKSKDPFGKMAIING